MGSMWLISRLVDGQWKTVGWSVIERSVEGAYYGLATYLAGVERWVRVPYLELTPPAEWVGVEITFMEDVEGPVRTYTVLKPWQAEVVDAWLRVLRSFKEGGGSIRIEECLDLLSRVLGKTYAGVFKLAPEGLIAFQVVDWPKARLVTEEAEVFLGEVRLTWMTGLAMDVVVRLRPRDPGSVGPLELETSFTRV